MGQAYYGQLGAQAFEAVTNAVLPAVQIVVLGVVIVACLASVAVIVIKGWDLIVAPWWRDVLEGVGQGFGFADYDTDARHKR